MFLISVSAFILADRWGRRTIVTWEEIILAVCMAVVGSLYASDSVDDRDPSQWFVIVLIFVFALTYVSTWDIIGKIYISEILPAHNRATANSLAHALNLYAQTVPVYFMMSSCNCV
jgi:MFS family permease